MSKTVKWLLVGVVVLIGGLWGLQKAGAFGKDEGTKVTIEKAELKTIIETVNASGKIYPEVEVKISPDISGEIVDLTVAEGDSVQKGQLLAKIYADILLSQREQVSAGVSQATAQLDNASTSIGNLKAVLDQAERNFNRQQKLFEDKVISRLEFEQAQQTYLSAKANYDAAKVGLKTNEAGIKSAQAQLKRADKDLSRTNIYAPMSGVVSLLSVKKGEKVAGNSFSLGTEMLRIADLNSIVAQVDVGENDITKVKLGDTAVINVDAYNKRKFKGLVYKIANPITNQASAGSSTEVTNYKVHIRLLYSSYQDLIKKGSFPFRPGMTASADIQTRTERNVLSVPLNAVTTRNKKDDAKDAKKDDKNKKEEQKSEQPAPNNGEPTDPRDDLNEVVFVYDAATTTVKKVKVKTGIQDLNNIQIVEGLSAGQEVITGPYNVVSKTLKQGDKVKKTDKDKIGMQGEEKKN